MPAVIVRGSPKIGTHANNNDHIPNFLNQYDVLSITSFLEMPVSKIYITDIIQTYCMFDHEIITLIDSNTSNLSCVHRGLARTERKFIN